MKQSENGIIVEKLRDIKLGSNGAQFWLYINNTSDYEKFNNGSLIVYAGNYRFFNPSGQEFKTHPSTGIGRVYPN